MKIIEVAHDVWLDPHWVRSIHANPNFPEFATVYFKDGGQLSVPIETNPRAIYADTAALVTLVNDSRTES